jgi:AAA domain
MPTLVVMAGLPASGKSSIARELARQMNATWLRIDSMDQAIWASGDAPTDLRDWTYRAAQAVALDNLGLGHDVVGDCVNDSREARDGWAENRPAIRGYGTLARGRLQRSRGASPQGRNQNERHTRPRLAGLGRRDQARLRFLGMGPAHDRHKLAGRWRSVSILFSRRWPPSSHLEPNRPSRISRRAAPEWRYHSTASWEAA